MFKSYRARVVIFIVMYFAMIIVGVAVVSTIDTVEAMPQIATDHKITLITQEGIRDPAYGTTFYISVLEYQGQYYLANSKGGICAEACRDHR